MVCSEENRRVSWMQLIAGALEFEHPRIGLTRGTILDLHVDGGIDKGHLEVFESETMPEPGCESLGDACLGHPTQDIRSRFENELSHASTELRLKGALPRIRKQELDDFVSHVFG